MDKKTIIGIILMAAIFIGYVMYSSKQQAEYQEYMEQVQAEEVAKAEAELGDTGRILVRESGTEPLVRVMAEAENEEICRKYVDSVVDVIKAKGYAV